MKTELSPLTGLRGFAALWVLAFHLWLRFGSQTPEAAALLARAGYLGVDLFFVLSGFVIALNYAGDELHRSASGYAAFLWKRLARIWPVHFATATIYLATLFVLIAADIFPRKVPELSDYLFSLTLAHAWSVPVVMHWNALSWSVSAEWAAYLAFPVVALAAARVRSPLVGVIAAIACFAALGISVATTELGTSVAYGMHRIAAAFTAGVLLHRVWQLRLDRERRGWDSAAAAALVLLVVGGGAFEILVGKWTALAVFPAVAAVVVYGLAAGAGPLCRAFATAPMQYLGRVSYSLYLVHGPMIYTADSLSDHLGRGPQWAIYGAAVLASFALAHWLFRSVEEPARRAMVRGLERVTSPRSARRSLPSECASRT